MVNHYDGKRTFAKSVVFVILLSVILVACVFAYAEIALPLVHACDLLVLYT